MTPRTHRAPVMAGAMALALGLALSACGDSDSGTSDRVATQSPSASTSAPSTEVTPEPTEPTGPVCGDVWVAGQMLPTHYNGCQDDEKSTFVQAMIYRCSSGQKLVTFRRNFYAAKGEVINETATTLARDPGFKKVLASCGA